MNRKLHPDYFGAAGMGTIFTVKKNGVVGTATLATFGNPSCPQQWNRACRDSTGVTREFAWGQGHKFIVQANSRVDGARNVKDCAKPGRLKNRGANKNFRPILFAVTITRTHDCLKFTREIWGKKYLAC